MILSEIPEIQWPPSAKARMTKLPVRVWIGCGYLVQAYDEADGVVRLTVNSTKHESLRWADGIRWDDLQAIKSACGYGDRDAVEVYPRTADVVNVANMRHLWILPDQHASEQAIPFAWRKEVAHA